MSGWVPSEQQLKTAARGEYTLVRLIDGMLPGFSQAYYAKIKEQTTVGRIDYTLQAAEAIPAGSRVEVDLATGEIRRARPTRTVVSVKFAGTTQPYSYEWRDDRHGNEPREGQFAAVYSPRTDQTEIVKIVGVGESPWSVVRPHAQLKIARPVSWEIVSG